MASSRACTSIGQAKPAAARGSSPFVDSGAQVFRAIGHLKQVGVLSLQTHVTFGFCNCDSPGSSQTYRASGYPGTCSPLKMMSLVDGIPPMPAPRPDSPSVSAHVEELIDNTASPLLIRSLRVYSSITLETLSLTSARPTNLSRLSVIEVPKSSVLGPALTRQPSAVTHIRQLPRTLHKVLVSISDIRSNRRSGLKSMRFPGPSRLARRDPLQMPF